MSEHPDEHRGVGLIARNPTATRFFLQQKDAAYPRYPRGYSTFGGAIEPGEDPERALNRELGEELGPAAASMLGTPALVREYRVTPVDPHPDQHGQRKFRFWLFEAIVDDPILTQLAAIPVLEGERGVVVDGATLPALAWIWGLEQVIADYVDRLATTPG
jgi:8-oxo-dGTP pyrophosphatase MutT (NUDIX family)